LRSRYGPSPRDESRRRILFGRGALSGGHSPLRSAAQER
jgi:hypothetical protein